MPPDRRAWPQMDPDTRDLLVLTVTAVASIFAAGFGVGFAVGWVLT